MRVEGGVIHTQILNSLAVFLEAYVWIIYCKFKLNSQESQTVFFSFDREGSIKANWFFTSISMNEIYVAVGY